MAKIVAPKSVQNQTPTEVVKDVEKVENVVETTNKPAEWVSLDQMQAILERIERLEKENNELREGKMNVFTSGREVYDWPRKFNYKLWWGKPVLSYKSFKKDPTKDLVFKDQFWQWKSNHYLKLTLADNSEVEVEVNEFNRDYERSEKVYAEKVTDTRGHVLGYEFDTEEYGKIIVNENMIN